MPLQGSSATVVYKLVSCTKLFMSCYKLFLTDVARHKGAGWVSNPRLHGLQGKRADHLAKGVLPLVHDQLEDSGRTVNCKTNTKEKHSRLCPHA